MKNIQSNTYMNLVLNKQIQKKFEGYIFNQFQYYHKNQNINEHSKAFLKYLISRKLIDPQAVYQFVIFTEYSEIIGFEKFKPLTENRIFELIGERYSMNPNTVWNIVREKNLTSFHQKRTR